VIGARVTATVVRGEHTLQIELVPVELES
jgi:hypothetical protein